MRHGELSDRVPLRIAMVAPPWFEVPPTAYGGIEALIGHLVDQLVDRRHDVLLVGAGRHRTKARRFVAVADNPLAAQLGQPVPEVLHAARTAAALRDIEIDLVHDHTLAGPLLAEARTVPTVVTAHGEVDG